MQRRQGLAEQAVCSGRLGGADILVVLDITVSLGTVGHPVNVKNACSRYFL